MEQEDMVLNLRKISHAKSLIKDNIILEQY